MNTPKQLRLLPVSVGCSPQTDAESLLLRMLPYLPEYREIKLVLPSALPYGLVFMVLEGTLHAMKRER